MSTKKTGTTKKTLKKCFEEVEKEPYAPDTILNSNREFNYDQQKRDWEEKQKACNECWKENLSAMLECFESTVIVINDTDRLNCVEAPEVFLDYIKKNTLEVVIETLGRIEAQIESFCGKAFNQDKPIVSEKRAKVWVIIVGSVALVGGVILSVLWGCKIREDVIAYAISAADFVAGILGTMIESISDVNSCKGAKAKIKDI